VTSVSSEQDSALLTIESLKAGYGEITVLWGVNLVVSQGDITALIGSNGAGKSTLMRTISGLVPASAGTIMWQQTPIQQFEPEGILELGVAHVPEGRRLFSAMTVEENLLMGAYLRRVSRTELNRDLDLVYSTFEKLRERRSQAAGTLSGGEQQMCAIGRGLMSAPRLLMIDELSLGLSPILVEQLLEALKKLNREGLTILLVEQDVMTALEVSNYAYVMDMGRTVNQGVSDLLMRDPAVRDAYLGAITRN